MKCEIGGKTLQSIQLTTAQKNESGSWIPGVPCIAAGVGDVTTTTTTTKIPVGSHNSTGDITRHRAEQCNVSECTHASETDRQVTFELIGCLCNSLNHGCIEHVRVQIVGVGTAAQHRRKH